MTRPADEFGRYKELILHELTRVKHEIEKLNDSIHSLALDVTAQKLRVGFLGALAGSIPVALMLIWEYFQKG